MKLSSLLIMATMLENVGLDERLQSKIKNLYNNYPKELQERFKERGAPVPNFTRSFHPFNYF